MMVNGHGQSHPLMVIGDYLEVPLLNYFERKAIIDAEDSAIVLCNQWWATFYSNAPARIVGRVDGKLVGLARYLLKAPKNLEVDHIDRDIFNNRRCNLRFADKVENASNSGPRMGRASHGIFSKYKGVSWENKRNKWLMSFKYLNIRKVARYETEIEAAKAYDVLAKQYRGDFAYLNFPEGY